MINDDALVNAITARYVDNLNKEKSMCLSSFASLLSSAKSFVGEDDISPNTEPRLAMFLSPNVNFDTSYANNSHTSCSIPSLNIKKSLQRPSDAPTNMSPKDAAALKLATPFYVDRENVEKAPGILLENVCESIMALIESRIKSSISALLKKTYDEIAATEISILISFLQNSPVNVNAVVTTFHVLGMQDNRVNSHLCLPLVFEVVMDLAVIGVVNSISFQVPGTIAGSICQSDGLLERVEITLDTNTQLDQMIKEARLVAQKAIADSSGAAHFFVKDLFKSMSTLDKKRPINSFVHTFDESSFNLTKGCSKNLLNYVEDMTNFLGNDDWSQTKLTHSRRTASNQIRNLFPNIQHPTVSDQELNMTRKDKEKPYKLFSWLSGDKMLLNEDMSYISSKKFEQHDKKRKRIG